MLPAFAIVRCQPAGTQHAGLTPTLWASPACCLSCACQLNLPPEVPPVLANAESAQSAKEELVQHLEC